MATKTVVTCCQKYDKQVKADAKTNNPWRYYNSQTSGTFNAAVKNNNHRANCATIANWALRDLKVFVAGNYIWGRVDGKLMCSDETMAALKKHCKVIHVNGKKTIAQAIKDNTLQAGDIVTYQNIQHTNIYAGNNRWYDAGHAYAKGSGDGAILPNFYGKTVYGDQKIAYIIRYKGNATSEPQKQKKKIFRVQFLAPKTQLTAERYVKKCKKKLGLDAFYEKMNDGLYHCFCGSFEDFNKAKERLTIVQTAFPTAFIKEVEVDA